MRQTISVDRVDLSTLSSDTYDFKKRVTQNELIRAYSRQIKSAQEEYISKLNAAAIFLSRNLRKCQEIDQILGVSPEIEEEFGENEDIPEGKERCPIHTCQTSTVKLRRHLKTHSLTEPQVDYALGVSRVFAKNSQPSQQTTAATTSKAGRPSNTNLVNRKCNYKECPVCKKLVLNITDHLKNLHKINDTNPKYKDYIKNCRVIPKIYTKKQHGVTTLLLNESLDAAKEEYEEEVNKQMKTLHELKVLREKIENLTEQLKENPNKEDEKKLQELTVQYNKEKNTESRTYPPKIIQWMTTFEKFLITRGDNNPKRGTKMATEVFFPDNSTEEVSLSDLLDVLYVRTLLQNFKQRTSTNSTTKIKYIKYFEMFIKFLARDVSSPEYKKDLSNEELISQNLKKEDIL